MQATTLQPGYNPLPHIDERWCITRIVHQVMFLFAFVLQKLLQCCSRSQSASFEMFQSLGGRVEAIRRFDLSQGQVENGGRIVIPSDANVYPVCVAGRNRSQITKHVLERKGVAVERMSRPHGAILGMDVLDANDDHEIISWLGGIRYWDEDLGTYGTLRRTPRAGEEETGELDKYERRRWMDENYFLRILLHKSMVITYGDSAQPLVDRLREVARRYGLGLNNVHLVYIDSDDPVPSCKIPQFVNCLDQLFSVE